MKKLIVILIAVIGFCGSISAQNAKASGNFFGQCGDDTYLSINLYRDGTCTYNRTGVKGEGTYSWSARMYEGRITLKLTNEITGKTFTVTGSTTNDGNSEIKSITIDGCGTLKKSK